MYTSPHSDASTCLIYCSLTSCSELYTSKVFGASMFSPVLYDLMLPCFLKCTHLHSLVHPPALFHCAQTSPTARLCGHFVSHLFTCPDVPPPPALPSTTPTPRLDHFITYSLHHTHLHPSVTCEALYLLQHLKACFPAAEGSSGHHVFIWHSC
jgi:hypothetical protein